MSSGPIQTLPRGLLGLMQLKNLGRNPSQLEDTVQSVLPIDEYWLRNQARLDPRISQATINTGPGVLARFTGTPIIVPLDEVWWVEHYTLAIDLTSDNDYIHHLAGVLFYDTVAGSPDWSALTVGINGGAANTLDEKIIFSARNFWAPPGAEFGYCYGSVGSAVATTLFGRVRRASLPI